MINGRMLSKFKQYKYWRWGRLWSPSSEPFVDECHASSFSEFLPQCLPFAGRPLVALSSVSFCISFRSILSQFLYHLFHKRTGYLRLRSLVICSQPPCLSFRSNPFQSSTNHHLNRQCSKYGIKYILASKYWRQQEYKFKKIIKWEACVKRNNYHHFLTGICIAHTTIQTQLDIFFTSTTPSASLHHKLHPLQTSSLTSLIPHRVNKTISTIANPFKFRNTITQSKLFPPLL